jgi:hypothetical protein
MATAKTKIDGYSVEFQKYQEGEDMVTQCFINHKNYTASLECLDATGELEDYSHGRVIQVLPQTINAIKVWAEEQGY